MAPDKVVPLSPLDQINPVDTIIITSCLIVQGHLDPDALKRALNDLVKRWPVLGSRIARNKKGSLELHVPDSFSESRPPFIFTTQETNTFIPDRPSRSQYLQPEILKRIHHFLAPNTPRLTTDLLKAKDAPIIHVHVHHFTDVTCIGFSIPHAVVDYTGLGIILRAWCSLIANKDNMQDIVLPALFESDPLADFGAPYPSKKKEALAFRKATRALIPAFNLWENIRYYTPLILDLTLNAEESRTLFIPLSIIEKTRQEIMSSGEKPPWVSENDIVVAILAKFHSFNRANSKKKITLAFVGTLRNQIPPLKGPKVFLGNAHVPMCCVPVSITDFKRKSISEFALEARETIIASRTEDQLSRSTTLLRELSRSRALPSYNDANGTNFFVTSWAAAKTGELDFSAALVDAVPDGGKVIYSGGFATNPAWTQGRCRWSIISTRVLEGIDGEAGYFCEVGARLTAWPEIEKVVASWC